MKRITIEVLFIEDAEKDVAVMLEFLIKEGYKVHSERVSTDEEMIAAMNKQEWDLIISAYQLLSFDAVAAFDVLKRHQKNIPFIVVSENTTIEVAVLLMKKGAQYYLLKSNLATLGAVVKNELSTFSKENQEEYYSPSFEASLMPIFEQDFSGIKKEVEALKAQGITDFKTYFYNEQEKMIKLLELVKVLNVNQASVKLIEANSKEHLLKSFNSICIGKSIKVVIWQFLAIASGDLTCEFDSKIRTLKGEEKDIHIKWKVANGYEENYDKVFLYIEDITQRTKVQAQLEKNKVKLELIYNYTSDLIFLLSVEEDSTFKWVSVNQAFCDVTGLDSEGIVGNEVEYLLHQKESKFTIDKCKEAIRAKKSFFYEESFDLLEGQIILEIKLTPIFDSNGLCTHLLAVAHNITEYKHAEKKLQVSKQEVEELFELSPDFIFKIRVEDWSLVQVNQRACDFYGYTREEFLSMNLSDIEFNKKGQDFIKRKFSFMAMKEVVEIEASNRKKNGIVFPAQIRIVKLDEYYGLASVRDISKDEKMEEELSFANEILQVYVQELEDKTLEFDQFFFSSRDIICIVKSDGYLKRANPAFLKIFGYDRMELFSLPFSSHIYPGDLEKGRSVFDKLGSDLNYSSYENRYKANDGTYRWLSWRSVLDKKTNLRYVTARDITEEKQANREIEDIMNALNQSSAVTMSRPNGEITYVNDAFSVLSQYSPEEILGRTHKVVNSGHHSESFMKDLLGTIFKGKVWRGELKNRRKDGTFYWTDTTIIPQLDTGGAVVMHISIRRDISHRKFVEAALEESQKELLDLTIHSEQERERERARIALNLHDDLGQKLTALNLGVGWLDQKLSSISPEVKVKMNHMSKAIGDAVNQVQEIASELRPSILDNLGLADAIAWQLKEFEKNTSVKSSLLIKPRSLTAGDDITILIFRIVQESLTNIARYAQATKVVIRLIENKKTIRLSIKDNGIGIKESALKNPKSFGLRGMQERTKWGRGTISIKGKEGEGTEVFVEFPLV
jgi:two-component system sensor histidine kinase NreB